MEQIRHSAVYVRTRPQKKTPGPEDRLLTVSVVAEKLNVSPSTVYNMMDSGNLPYITVGARGKRVKASVLTAFIENSGDFEE